MVINKQFYKTNELFDFFKELSGNYVFRGVKQNNEYYPSVLRWYERIPSDLKKRIFEHYEKWLMQEFALRTKSFSFESEHFIDLIARAQHYGLPTRLLDWTYDRYIALYFAANNCPVDLEKVQILICNLDNNIFCKQLPEINPSDNYYMLTGVNLIDQYLYVITQIFSGSECIVPLGIDELSFSNLIKEQEEKKFNGKSLFFTDASNKNNRIVAQKGLFQILRYTTNYKQNIIDNCEYILDIPNCILMECLDILAAEHNITHKTVFPDQLSDERLVEICKELSSAIPTFEQTEPRRIEPIKVFVSKRYKIL